MWHSLSQEVPHKPHNVLRCRDWHLVWRMQFAVGVLSKKKASPKNPHTHKTKKHNTTHWKTKMERKGRKTNKIYQMKSQEHREAIRGWQYRKPTVSKNNWIAKHVPVQQHKQRGPIKLLIHKGNAGQAQSPTSPLEGAKTYPQKK